uniref:Cytochrome P450 monooxygenase notH' n=1 Tax=Aspergillus versicolor TaxID=46472 RepID=NOTH_ASPVE|nr:RecName: Full=Cytochrome P450 monooxygenase notH'; AltName: Full=Notoamide biosynthesis cluster protein H' [Aspergillus versicolor]AGC83579.1 P450 monooxygenase [Aspergillus versicolor]
MAQDTALHLPLGLEPAGWALALLTSSIIYLFLSPKSKSPRFPVVNKYWWDFFQAKAKRDFEAGAEDLIKLGLSKARTKPRREYPRLVLSDQLADAVGMDNRFDQDKGIAPVNLVTLKGFESMYAGALHDSVPRPATSATSKRLVHLTRPFSEETTDFLQREWTESPDWHDIEVYPVISRLTAQVLSRAFVGPRLCRDTRWLEIATTYISNRLTAVVAVQKWGAVLHPIVHWFLPSCRRLRAQNKRARELLQPELDRIKESPLEDETFTSLAWIHGYGQGYIYDPGLAQLRLSAVANHTTSDMMTKTLIRICENPELIQPLREEAIEAVRGGGLRVAALQKMFLMESVMQESQRLEPFILLSMFRYATETVTLPEGTTIPKGTLLAIANPSRLDPAIYPDPHKFDGYRFVRMREDPRHAHLAPFTKTNSTNLNFGHGKQACPGRFIAVNQIKIALCHMLLKYDIELVEECPSQLVRSGLVTVRNPGAKIRVRRRQEEVCL